MRIIAYPESGIAYIDSFYAAIRQCGCTVVEGVWSGRWIIENLRNDDVVHFHWPSFLYEPQGRRFQIIVAFARYCALLCLIRIKGARIVWTAHNLYPHDRARWPLIDKMGRRLVVRLSSHIFAHSRTAAEILEDEFPQFRRKRSIIPHGHWIDRYGPLVDKIEARKQLGISPNSFVYLVFGQCKPYKNIRLLVDVFRRAAEVDDQLIIVGRFSDSAFLSTIQEASAGAQNIQLRSEFIPDEDVATYFGASDIMCMPYQEILTSGTAVLALSYGRPVLSIDRGFLHDVVSGDLGVLVPPGDIEALKQAMQEVKRSQWSEPEIIAHANQFTFDDAARLFLDTLAPRAGELN